MINFVIPSIGRDTIKDTLQSILNQTNPNWECWVGFDGKQQEDIDPNSIIQDSRIKYIYFDQKFGNQDNHHGNAGVVRNNIIDKVDNNYEWIAFVDDDDTLSKYYLEILELEISKNDFDCCVFRMRYDINNVKVIPPFGMNDLRQNFVGISFCVRKKFIEDNNIKFCNSNSEDFSFLKSIKDSGGNIYMSSHITYNVNGYLYGQK